MTAKHTRNVLIVTGQHFADAPRKVDLHFIADALRAQGAHVDFLACRLSFASRYVDDGRWVHARRKPLNRWRTVAPDLDEFIWYAPFHPMNLRHPLVNALTAPLFSRYDAFLPRAVIERLSGYTHALIESGPSPLLARKIRRHAPDARIIYHAADRLSTINVHPCVEAALRHDIGVYDLVHIMAEAMRPDFPAGAPVLYLPHGISKADFDGAGENPYPGGRNAVSVGDMLFDAEVIDVLAEACPDWRFHLFGKKATPLAARPNILVHGEVPFAAVVPFIKFADVGLAPYRAGAGADYLSQSSLKMIQYSYCRLPIVAPHFAAAGRDHVSSYAPGNPGEIRAAFAQAIAFDRERIDTRSILGWDEAVRRIFD